MSREKDKKPEFEESLKRIEEIVAAMEKGSLPLEQALERYEEGVRLTRFCSQTLDAAEKKIEILSKGETGEETVRQFSPDAGGEDSRDTAPRPAKRRNREEDPTLF